MKAPALVVSREPGTTEVDSAMQRYRKGPASVETSFWLRVRKGEGCWEWSGWRAGSGYGQIKVNKRIESAHRLSWILHHGAIPKGLIVCHHCDNPPCVRPDHLFLGTYSDNVRDAMHKGRMFTPEMRKRVIDAARARLRERRTERRNERDRAMFQRAYQAFRLAWSPQAAQRLLEKAARETRQRDKQEREGFEQALTAFRQARAPRVAW